MPDAVKQFKMAAQLGFGDSAFDVVCQEALTPQFHAMQLRFDVAFAKVSAPSSPQRLGQVFRRPQRLVTRCGKRGDGCHGNVINWTLSY